MRTCICCGDQVEGDSSFCDVCADEELGHAGGADGMENCKKRRLRQSQHVPLGYGMRQK
jgi:hypothetical protein